MVKHTYLVEVSADYCQIANSPGQVRKSLISALRRNGLNEVNFSISVSRHDPEKGVDSTPKDVVKSKVKTKKSRRRKTVRK